VQERQSEVFSVAMGLDHPQQAGRFATKTDECFAFTEGPDLLGQTRIIGFELTSSHSCDGGVGQTEADLSLSVGGDYIGQVEGLLCGKHN
jgi:hypothetical protein